MGFACDPGDDFDVLRTIYPACQAGLLFKRSCSVFKNKKNQKTAILEKIRMSPGREMPTIKRCVPRHSDNQYNHQIFCNTCIQLQRMLQKP